MSSSSSTSTSSSNSINNNNNDEKIINAKSTIPENFTKVADAAEWYIPWTAIKLGEKLGEGAYGIVYSAEYAGLTIAAKKLKGAIAPDSVKEEFETEVETLKKLRHPTILLFMGVTKDNSGNWYILSEYARGGSLDRILQKTSYTSWSRRTRYLKDIALAVAYLHENGCLHRDLKAENVLINSVGVCKVADFGLARMFGKNIAKAQLRSEMKDQTNGIGSLWWRAPEVDDPTKEYTGKVDVFSFGITAAEIITNGLPGDEIRLEGTYQHPEKKLVWIFESARLKPLLSKFCCPPVLIDVVIDATKNEPSQRPSIQKIAEIAKKVHKCVSSIEKQLKTALGGDASQFAFPLFSKNLSSLKSLESPFILINDLYISLKQRISKKFSKELDDLAFRFFSSEKLSKFHQSKMIPLQPTIAFLQWFLSLESLLENERIKPLFREKMIHGFISKQDAVKIVQQSKPGALVVRFSSRPGKLAITYKRPTNNQISHALIQVTNHGIASGSQIFQTFGSMLQSKPQYKYIAPDQPLSKWAALNAELNQKFAKITDSESMYEVDADSENTNIDYLKLAEQQLLSDNNNNYDS